MIFRVGVSVEVPDDYEGNEKITEEYIKRIMNDKVFNYDNLKHTPIISANVYDVEQY